MVDNDLREIALKAAGDAVGQSRPYEDDIVVAVDAVLAAIRASGRLAPEADRDLIERTMGLFDKPRFGRIRRDGSFEEVSRAIAETADCDDCQWLGGDHDGRVVRAYLAAIRDGYAQLANAGPALPNQMADRTASDVLEAAINAIRESREWDDADIVSVVRDGLRAELAIAAPLIAAAAEAKAREDIAAQLSAWAEAMELGLTVKSKEVCRLAVHACAKRIRSGAAS